MENKRTLQNDPQYFGAYLNMARHNIFVINNHLAERFEETILTGEEHISDSFFANNIPVKTNHVFSHLTRFIPIAKVFDPEQLPKEERTEEKLKAGKDFNKLKETFKICFSELNDFRNDYSHFFSTEKRTERKIKVDKLLADFLTTNYSRAIQYSIKRFSSVFEYEHFKKAEERVLVNKINDEITQDGLVFFACLFLDRENAFQFINKIIGLKDTRTPEFIATREVFSAFCVTLPHDRFISDDPEQAFILDMLNELNRCPSELFNSLTEEGKKPFQPTLDKDKISSIEASSISEDLKEEDFDEYIQSIIKRIRHQDRFPYFALKYLDTSKAFKNIRFQIDLGKFQIDEYKKPFNNTEEDRMIIENAKAFGRLNEFTSIEKTKEEVAQEIEGKINSKKFKNVGFKQFAPRYNYDPELNKIGFQFYQQGINDFGRNENGDFVKYPQLLENKNPENKAKYNLTQNNPDGFFSIHELPKIVLLELLVKGTVEKQVRQFIISNKTKILNKQFIEEIKSKLKFEKPFYKKFQGKNDSAYNKENLDKLKERKELLNKLLEPHQLNEQQIPTRIVDYWLDIEEVREELAIANRIKAMKKECAERLKDKKKGKAPLIGEMATFLAKDMVDMVINENVKKKITSFYYDKMQECLALFADPDKKKLFIHISSIELNLFNKETGHPFLQNININDIHYTSEFYEKYLIEKGNKLIREKVNKKDFKTQKYITKEIQKDKSWLNLNFYTEEKNLKTNKWETKIKLPNDLSKLPFSIRKLDRTKSNFNAWLDNVTKGKPIDLPTDLFDNALTKILTNKMGTTHNPKHTYSYLLTQWLKDTQPFYDFERHYKVYETPVIFKLQEEKKFINQFSDKIKQVLQKLNKERQTERKPLLNENNVLRVFNNAITENEKLIRFYQTKDRVILLMLKELMKSDGDLKITLKEIESSLNETVTIKQKVNGKIIYAERKRKDYTVFKRFISDRRLPELFQYFKEDEIHYQKLKDELDEYNKVKEWVFDRTFELEKSIIKKSENEIRELFKNEAGNKKEGNIKYKPYLLWLKGKGFINDNEFEFLNTVRNAFSHNQFPPKIIMDKNIEWQENIIFSSQIYEQYAALIRTILDEITPPIAVE